MNKKKSTQEKKITHGLYKVGESNYLLSNGPDMISAHLRKGKVWEQACLDIAQLLIERIQNPVLVDVGANLGAWSVPMGQHVKKVDGRIYSFEPQRQVFYQLCANYLINDLSNCYANNMAVGDYNGEIDVPQLDPHRSHNLGALSLNPEIRIEQQFVISPETRSEKVRIATLDSLNLPKAHLIKIDVEGLELEVISGAKNWLSESGYPPILFEVWGDYMQGMIAKRNELMSLVEGLGYHVDLFGELCIAQHHSNKRLGLTIGENQLTIQRL
ncbi:FkbM family methyltransferase [Limnobaculum zhutongyuii]|uniref:FkbM family methyltransferase n=1 Tax=Limnobaculum zhutongyuii TaxID=2498113 RepID=A0A411WMR6_9GAMM|nr:FkbM family methyltransferase [Limnobaculum zhutongyuii]QBH97472.1 FkbM family methyltransferase [Limnobaculum zhutongyuii]TQS90947.1 FkbM family methyltransferase [Limnobaculum zhutongyuii]